MLQTENYLENWTWYSFNMSNLYFVPEESGIYCLGVNSNIIYIGRSGNLHERLTNHYNTGDPCIAQATRFAIEGCTNYVQREAQMLQWFRSKYGKLPACNERIV